METTKLVVKGIIIVILTMAFIFIMGFAIQGNDFFLLKTFAPKYEQVRYDTFKQSQAYNDGMANEVNKVQLKYTTATDSEKATLASYILSELGAYDTQNLPPNQRSFIEKLKRGEK